MTAADYLARIVCEPARRVHVAHLLAVPFENLDIQVSRWAKAPPYHCLGSWASRNATEWRCSTAHLLTTSFLDAWVAIRQERATEIRELIEYGE